MKAIFYLIIPVLLMTNWLAGCGKQPEKTTSAQQTAPADASPLEPTTTAKLISQGARALTTDEIKKLIVGKMITIKHLPTGREITGHYNEDGTRTLIEFDKDVVVRSGSSAAVSQDPYRIESDRLYAIFGGNPISTTIYQLDDHYLAAVSDENGAVNYEVIPPRHK